MKLRTMGGGIRTPDERPKEWINLISRNIFCLCRVKMQGKRSI